MKKILLLLALFAMGTMLMAQGMHQNSMHGKDLNHNGREHGQRMGMGGGMNCDDNGGFMFSQLELTADQKEVIEQKQQAHRKDMIDFKANLDKLAIDMRNAMKDDNFKSARKIQGQISDIKAQKALAKITLKEEINKVLTDDQRNQLRELKLQHPHRGMGNNQDCDREGGKGHRK